MSIKVTLIEEPTMKDISMDCPGCGASLLRSVPKDAKSGETRCNICKAKFKWEEIDDN